MPARIKTSAFREIYAPRDVVIPSRLGGGILKERVVRDLPSRRVVHYSLAYINTAICGIDNGRVLGYDNRHGWAHRHFMGAVTPVTFDSYEALYGRFENEWQSIAMNFVNGEPL